MRFYERNQELIAYSNHDDTNLRVDNSICEALKNLGFCSVYNNQVNEGVFKLIIWHGGFPKVPLFEYPTVLMRMSSQGLSVHPEILNERIENIWEPFYCIQGGANSSRLPGNQVQWEKLITWLLDINVNKLKEGDAAPLPAEHEISKFIYTEPYPDALVGWYLAEVARQKDIEINYANLLEDIKQKADAEYKELAKAHGHTEEFDISGIRELFEKIAKT